MADIAPMIPLPDIAPVEAMLRVDVAVARLSAIVPRIEATEQAPLLQSAGRVAAKTIRAAHPMPSFDNSAMDGFAVSLADFAEGVPLSLPISGVAAAGSADVPALVPGTCMRIYTGAPVPVGADAIVPFEQVVEKQSRAAFPATPRLGAHIRRMGSDIASGDVLLAAGTRISGRHAGLLAANGHQRLTVYRRPRIGVFSTGDELVATDGHRQPWQVHDANRPMLLVMLGQMACDAVDLGIVPDELAQTQQFFNRCAGKFDLLISSGAVSAGGRDHLKTAFSLAGGVIDNWKVAMKPGKPVMFGRIGGAAFLGLPGNPLAAWVGFQIFGRRAVELMLGIPARSPVPVRAIADSVMRHKSGRREYVPVRVVSHTHRGQPLVTRVGDGGSASLEALCRADGVVIIEALTGDAAPGHQLDFFPFTQGVVE